MRKVISKDGTPIAGSVRTQDTVRRLKKYLPTSAPKRREKGFIVPTRELILNVHFPTSREFSLSCTA